MHESHLRITMVEIGKLLYQRGWCPAYDGNFSARLPDGSLLTTPAGRCKGHLQPDDLVIVALDGTPRDLTAPAPSTELHMHLAAYRVRPQINACVHAHPPLAIACSVAGITLTAAVLPEIIMTLGKIPTIPYAMTGTSALGEAIAPVIAHHDGAILDHHGTIAVGSSLLEALHRTEMIEHAATIIINAHTLGTIRRVPRADVEALLQVRRTRGGDPASEPALA